MKVSVVILSYNAKDMLKRCVDSVLKYTSGIDYEVIIVDNASTDGVQDVIKSYGKKVKPIFSDKNLGFTGGNNLGIKEAKGDYVLLLNNDTEFVENTLPIMHLWMESHPKVAVSSCQMLDSEQKVSPTGGFAPTLGRVLNWALFLDDLPGLSNIFTSYHPHSGGVPWNEFFSDLPLVGKLIKKPATGPKSSEVYNYDKEFYPDWITGAFFFMRRKTIDQIGPLDENLFMYAEDLEWCLRAKRYGWEVGYAPVSKFIHFERGSQGGIPRNAILGEFRGLKYVYGKFEPIWKQLILGSILDIMAFSRAVFWIVRLKPQMAKVYLDALVM